MSDRVSAQTPVTRTHRLTQEKLRRPADVSAAPSVALPPAVLAEASQLDSPPAGVPDAARPGRLLTAWARVLLTGLGLHNASLYAIPTEKGQVCGVYSTAYGTLGCSRAPAAGSAVQWDLGDVDAIGSGEPAFVDGFAPPDVTSVQVLAQGATWTAKLAHGAFFFQLPRADEWPESLRITRAGGRIQAIPLPKPPTATSPTLRESFH